MNANEKLDAVLQFLNHAYEQSITDIKIETPEGIYTQFASRDRGIKTFTEIVVGLRFTNSDRYFSELPAILEYLLKAEYITVHEHLSETYYRILWSGKVFIENGGYTGLTKRTKNIERRKSIENILLVFGTLAAGIYGLFEIAKFIYVHSGK